ncbi:MAG: enoyl-CoA hydratase-related protein, partial [Candidatus Puniceispirillaceae bacterium]
GDAFHAVGGDNPMIAEMISTGFTGDKGKGGFYMTDANGVRMARQLAGHTGDGLPAYGVASKALPKSAIAAAEATARQDEPLLPIIDGRDPQAQFCRRVLGRVLHYAAGLIPDVTTNPQDIDDAMKLGFNWQRGPFEMIDAIGSERFAALCDECDLSVPNILADGSPTYSVSQRQLLVRHDGGARHPVNLPDGVMRFSLTRRTLTPVLTNDAASLFALDGDLRLIEFHSKANALTDESMQIVAAAAKDHGKGIIVHNDAQHFSAGVDLNAFRAMIEAQDWDGIDGFLWRFQMAVKALKYAPVPVVGAPSGLGVGGGFEVLAHCDKLVVHSNSVLGLVESAVGVVPSGGGVKESYLRWYQQTGSWDEAAWKCWMNIGYAATGSSPELSARLQYFRPDQDETIMNRDRLLPRAIALVGELAANYQPPQPPNAQLASASLAEKMADFMQAGVDKGDFMPHDKTTAMAIASIMVQSAGDAADVDEDTLYARERAAFISLAKTAPTHQRISSMLDDGAPVRN